ncbi:MAG TPA: DNA polymerase I [Actinomycetes bacterium]|nr:DNA polymerase I [Actinomycetes bacterium]
MADSPTLLLLDGHSLAYRAFYALPVENFSTATGQPTNAVYGFTSMLINALRDEDPTHVAVAFDVSRTTFRTEQFADYKANRSKTPDEFRGQISLIKEVLDALQIQVIEVDGYEADDVIATLATQATAEGFDVEIITGDRDTFQLVNDHVTVLYPKRGVSDLSRMTPDAVFERYGLTPAQYPDFAALRGDPSDNLPGIPGVGEKTAAKWIVQFGSFDELVTRVDEAKGKVGDALRANLAQVITNRQLTELIKDVPLDRKPADLKRLDWDREAVHRVFDALEFRVLRERLSQTLQNADEPVDQAPELDVAILTSADLETWLASNGRGRVGVAVRGAWGSGAGRVEAIAFATDAKAVATVALDTLDDTARSALASWLGDDSGDHELVLHDANGPMLALDAVGMPIATPSFDTALAAYLLRPDQRSYDLDDLVIRWLHRELVSVDESGQLSLDADGDVGQAQQLGAHALAILELAAAMAPEVESIGATSLLTDVELPLTALLVSMERSGIAVDTEALDQLRAEFAHEVKRAAESAYDVIGREVNLGSPKQLQVVLFDELGMPKTKRTKTGYTTDADALTVLYAQTEHPFLAHLLRHRDVSKLLVTVEGLQRSIAPDGRIHTMFMQTVAATGRLSSTDPNLQNIPVRTEEGRRIRSTFCVGEGYESLMTADYSQVEMRIMAHLSEDAGLIEAFNSGEDLHTTVASRVFEVDPGSVTPEMRSKIKAMSYGLAYGLSAYGLSQQLGVGTDEAKALMDEYFERFGGVRDYLASVVDDARKTGYTQTVLGRRRYLPDLTSDNRQRREMAERMALNAPIQGSAADIVKVAMLAVERELRSEGLRSRLLLQVHDELVLEVAPGEAEAVASLVTEQMRSAYPLAVELDISVGFGRTWHDAAH